MYGDEIDMGALEVKANVFRAIMSNCRVECFKDVYNKMKTCPESEKELIPNIIHIIKLLLIKQPLLLKQDIFLQQEDLNLGYGQL